MQEWIQKQVSGRRRLPVNGASPTGSLIWAKASSIFRAAGCPPILFKTWSINCFESIRSSPIWLIASQINGGRSSSHVISKGSSLSSLMKCRYSLIGPSELESCSFFIVGLKLTRGRLLLRFPEIWQLQLRSSHHGFAFRLFTILDLTKWEDCKSLSSFFFF